MRYTQRRTIKVFGIEVGRVEVTQEFNGLGNSPERKGQPTAAMDFDPDYMTPILVEAIGRSGSFFSGKISFGEGLELVVNEDVDKYTGTQELKKRFGFDGSQEVLFGFTALTNAYDSQNAGAALILKKHIRDVLRENWENKDHNLHEIS